MAQFVDLVVQMNFMWYHAGMRHER